MRLLPHVIVYSNIRLLVGALLCALMMACGTGIEVTEHVTDKDVRRVMEQSPGHQTMVTLEAFRDSLPAWKIGKRFWVADDQVKEILATSAGYDKDTLHLAGHTLLYQGHSVSGVWLDDYNGRWVYLDLEDSESGATYVYRAGKEVEACRAGFTFPMLIDLDMVDHVARQIVDKDFYINTPIWYDCQSGQMMDGRHFIKVHIDSVLPGNAVLPLLVHFTTADTREKAMVWMSDKSSTMHGRDFDALFAASDPHLAYPTISDETWERITRAQVVEGMTKDECRLSIGSPKSIRENPDQGGLREYWYYDGGSYLYFVDGLLSQFSR